MRKLSSKTINSLALCVALAAPLVYLFGSMFMALAGAHGTIPFAEPIITNEFQEVQTYVEDGSTYKLEVTESIEPLLQEIKDSRQTLDIQGLNAVINGTEVRRALFYYNGSTQAATFYTLNASNNYNPIASLGTTYTENTIRPWLFTGDKLTEPFVALLHPYGKLYKSVPTIVGENEPSAGANTAFTFGNFFWYDNFLSASGREVLNGTPLYGFEPIGELIRYTDENMLHLANLSYGPLVIGYTYYCAHVIIVDLIFYIGSFIPRLIKKTINKLEGGLD